jgi:hypothetical protein
MKTNTDPSLKSMVSNKDYFFVRNNLEKIQSVYKEGRNYYVSDIELLEREVRRDKGRVRLCSLANPRDIINIGNNQKKFSSIYRKGKYFYVSNVELFKKELNSFYSTISLGSLKKPTLD